jgi:membrane-associated protein
MTRVLLGFVFAVAESGLGLGAIVPGEVAISSLAASVHGPIPVLALGLAVALGAVAGDHIGYLVGHFGGSRLRESRLVSRLGVDRWDKAADLMQQHGFWAVLGSRVLPVVRTVMPVVAGAAGLRYRSFLAASVIGGIGWAAVWVGAGAGIGASGILDHPVLIAAVAVVGLLFVAGRALLRRRRARAVPKSPVMAPELACQKV